MSSKKQAVYMLEEGGKTGHEIEQELGIGTGQVYRWRKAREAESRESGRAFPGDGRACDEGSDHVVVRLGAGAPGFHTVTRTGNSSAGYTGVYHRWSSRQGEAMLATFERE